MRRKAYSYFPGLQRTAGILAAISPIPMATRPTRGDLASVKTTKCFRHHSRFGPFIGTGKRPVLASLRVLLEALAPVSRWLKLHLPAELQQISLNHDLGGGCSNNACQGILGTISGNDIPYLRPLKSNLAHFTQDFLKHPRRHQINPGYFQELISEPVSL